MNTSQFMDKQIMDLTSSSSPSKDFIDLMNHKPDSDTNKQSYSIIGDGDGINEKEEILPSYDFQPIRRLGPTFDLAGGGPAPLRSWSSLDSSKANCPPAAAASPIRNYSSLDSFEASKVTTEKDLDISDSVLVSEIDKTMKKYADNLLNILEGVSARLTQLETRTRNLENSVDDLKVSVGNNHGSTDGRMRQMQNVLREVQTGVQTLKDKQDVVEAQLQLAKLQLSKANLQQSDMHNSGNIDAQQQAASAPLPVQQAAASAPPQSHQQLAPANFPSSIPPVPVPPSAVPPPPINPQPPASIPNQYPQNQISPVSPRESYYPPPGQPQEPQNPPYHVPQSQQPQLPSAAPLHQPYKPAPQSQYSQPPQLPQHQAAIGHHPEEISYTSPQTYPPSIHQPSSQSRSGAPPAQPFYGAPSQLYEPPSSTPSSGFSAGYNPLSGPPESYPYGGSPSQFVSSPTLKPQQVSSSAMSQSAGSGYPQLPTARVLPHAVPTATGIGGGSGSSGTGNRVPIDDVIDKVANMGFPREHVRATVRKLTENGQSVDLNIVLDKLMNDGVVQPQRGWFGR